MRRWIVGLEVKKLPGRTDQLLRIIAGEGNDIILWFLRIVASVLMVGSAVGILAGIVIVVSGRFSATDKAVSQLETLETAAAQRERKRLHIPRSSRRRSASRSCRTAEKTDSGGGGSSTLGASSSSSQWFQGGTLHNATVEQWKAATYKNKLATAADWLAATKWKGHLNSPDDFDRLKVKAELLVNCVDKVAAEAGGDFAGIIQVNEIGALLITMSNDLGP